MVHYILESPYYLLWKDALTYAIQTYPDTHQIVAHVYIKAKEYAGRLPMNNEGVQKFTHVIQSLLQQALGEQR
jgi:hypothetical protein